MDENVFSVSLSPSLNGQITRQEFDYKVNPGEWKVEELRDKNARKGSDLDLRSLTLCHYLSKSIKQLKLV